MRDERIPQVESKNNDSEFEIDPNLKECADEITRILKKHDVMGYVALSSPSRQSEVIHVGTSWSILEFFDDRIRIGLKDKENKSIEEQDKNIKDSFRAMSSFEEFGKTCANNFRFILEKIKEHNNNLNATGDS